MSSRALRPQAAPAAGAAARRAARRGAAASPPPVILVKHAQPFRLASRESHPESTIVTAGAVSIGTGALAVMAGPCSIESRQQIRETARRVKAAGADMLRGGAYKPRTSPYDFQGLGRKALEWLAEAGRESGLPVVTEVLSPEDVDLVAEYADLLQVGARNMQNYALLRRLATAARPVLLKRGPSATIQEWLLAAEYLLSGGNLQVVLCERGIRTFETATRNTLDLAGVALVKQLTHLPVIVDPSHGTGKRALVAPASRAAAAVGADGLLIEVHPCPGRALSDGEQSLDPAEFAGLMGTLRPLALAARA
ncbi:MAG TPA: 3-deoxy-7-phosphoheptulonate synthase [Candidatus Solibacter sp.]|nr:3-deoxy-7-phosphoheptulonate synthase [Candidatus Solibacter sp.]